MIPLVLKLCFVIFGQLLLLKVNDCTKSHENDTNYEAKSHDQPPLSSISENSTASIGKNNIPVVTRFAPSPTGFLHIGSARTALFNYLFARHHNGKFLLRIEDTDRKRSTEEAVEAIFSGLKWLGLQWDDEPIFQSKRNDLYKDAALKLLNEGKAYYCFTPQEEAEKQKKLAIEKEQYFTSEWRDKDPSTHPKDVKPVIRLKTPREGHTTIHDTVQGKIVVKNCEIDDVVLLRADGTATYMLAVVVDDHDMGITHIIRGDDHLTNTARQLAIYKALDYDVPSMTHVPLILGLNGVKLSKRLGALGIDAYKEMGYLPGGICNYLLRLGWSHGNDEIISMEQAIEWFNLDALGASSAHLDFARMRNLNAHYLRALDNDTLTSKAVEFLEQNYTLTAQEKSYIRQAMPSLAIRSETLLDVAELAKIYLINSPMVYEEEAKETIRKCDKKLIEQVVKDLGELEPFDEESVRNKCKEIATRNSLKLKDLMKPVRALVTGKVNSPGVFELAGILGKENILKRLRSYEL